MSYHFDKYIGALFSRVYDWNHTLVSDEQVLHDLMTAQHKKFSYAGMTHSYVTVFLRHFTPFQPTTAQRKETMGKLNPDGGPRIKKPRKQPAPVERPEINLDELNDFEKAALEYIDWRNYGYIDIFAAMEGKTDAELKELFDFTVVKMQAAKICGFVAVENAWHFALCIINREMMIRDGATPD
jgi:hypothetical protein